MLPMARNIVNRLKQAGALAVAGAIFFAAGCGNKQTQRERFLAHLEEGYSIKFQGYDTEKSEFDGDTLDVLFYKRDGDTGIYRMSIEVFGYGPNSRSKRFVPSDTMYSFEFLDELIKGKEAVVPKDPSKEIEYCKEIEYFEML